MKHTMMKNKRNSVGSYAKHCIGYICFHKNLKNIVLFFGAMLEEEEKHRVNGMRNNIS